MSLGDRPPEAHVSFPAEHLFPAPEWSALATGQRTGRLTLQHSLQGWMSERAAAALGMPRPMEFSQHLQAGEGRQLPTGRAGGGEGPPPQTMLRGLLRGARMPCTQEDWEWELSEGSQSSPLPLQQEKGKPGNLLNKTVKAALVVGRLPRIEGAPKLFLLSRG